MFSTEIPAEFIEGYVSFINSHSAAKPNCQSLFLSFSGLLIQYRGHFATARAGREYHCSNQESLLPSGGQISYWHMLLVLIS